MSTGKRSVNFNEKTSANKSVFFKDSKTFNKNNSKISAAMGSGRFKKSNVSRLC